MHSSIAKISVFPREGATSWPAALCHWMEKIERQLWKFATLWDQDVTCNVYIWYPAGYCQVRWISVLLSAGSIPSTNLNCVFQITTHVCCHGHRNADLWGAPEVPDSVRAWRSWRRGVGNLHHHARKFRLSGYWSFRPLHQVIQQNRKVERGSPHPERFEEGNNCFVLNAFRQLKLSSLPLAVA